MKKKFGADYEQLFEAQFLFYGQKINLDFFGNMAVSALKSCIE